MGQGSYPHFQSVLLPPGKARRLKQAKEEAQMEVDQYRREREQEFQSKQQAVSRGGVEMGPPVCMLDIWWDVSRVIPQEKRWSRVAGEVKLSCM